MPQAVKVGFKISFMQLRNLPFELEGQQVSVQFNNRATVPCTVDGKGVAKFPLQSDNKDATQIKFFRDLLYEKYNDKFVAFLCNLAVVQANGEIIAQGPFDLALYVNKTKKAEDVIFSLDQLGTD